MPVAVACPKCKKKYNLPDKMLGKPLQCTQCKAQFRTPAPSKATSRAPQADPRQLAKQRQAEAAARQQAGELQKLGVDGPIRKTPDVFDGLNPMQGTTDPLNNVVMDDPGFAEIKVKSIMDDALEEEDPQAGMFQNPALATPKKPKVKKGKKKQVSAAPLYLDPSFLVYVTFLPLAGILALLCSLNAISLGGAGLFYIAILMLHILASLAVTVYGVIRIYQTTPSIVQVLLCLFLPFYILYYWHKHWDSMKSYANACVAIVLTSFANSGAAYLIGRLEEV